MNKNQLILIGTLFFCIKVFAQSPGNASALKNKVAENSRLFETDINRAYHDLNRLIKESRKLKDPLSEMKLLEKKCRYFYSKNQIDSLVIASEYLQKASDDYGNEYYKAMADVYLAETYSVNKLYDKALFHLKNAYSTLLKDKSESKKILYAKANVLNSFANVYIDKNEPENAVKKLRKEIKSGSELKDKKSLLLFSISTIPIFQMPTRNIILIPPTILHGNPLKPSPRIFQKINP